MQQKTLRTAKFTSQDVMRVRELGDTKQMSVRELCDIYNCAPETIRKILRRETFREVPEIGSIGQERAMLRLARVDDLYKQTSQGQGIVEVTDKEILDSIMKVTAGLGLQAGRKEEDYEAGQGLAALGRALKEETLGDDRLRELIGDRAEGMKGRTE